MVGLFTFQRPLLFSPIILAVETEYNEREKHFLGSQLFEDYFFHIAKNSSSWQNH